MLDTYKTLKQKLLSLGALRPSTWGILLPCLEANQLAAGEVFQRQAGQVTYVTAGLLKEQAIMGKKHPTVINFITADSFIITETYNQHHHLTACTHTSLVSLQTDYLTFLAHKELIPIYRHIQDNHVADNYLRQLFLELADRSERIVLFKKHFRNYLTYFKKKEVASYLGINYTYLLHLYETL